MAPLPECCIPQSIKMTAVTSDKPSKLIAKIFGQLYYKGSGTSFWSRTPPNEGKDPAKWFLRTPDIVCECGCYIFTLRYRTGQLTARCANCSHEEPL